MLKRRKSGKPDTASAVRQEHTFELRIMPAIKQFNRCLAEVRHVSLREMSPVYISAPNGQRQLTGFDVRVEGLPQHLASLDLLVHQQRLAIGKTV
jgi:hypothetical protein